MVEIDVHPKGHRMIDLPETVALPIKMDEHGAIRVSGTRVTLDTLIARYQQDESPETIHEGFPTVPLADIYAVIAYYLAHQDEVDTYLKQRDEEAERTRQKVEANYTPEQKAHTERLRALLNQKRQREAAWEEKVVTEALGDALRPDGSIDFDKLNTLGIKIILEELYPEGNAS
jgi:uncharacterized protein (DUF433 family)